LLLIVIKSFHGLIKGSFVPLDINLSGVLLLLCSMKLAQDGDARLGQATGQVAAAPGEIHTHACQSRALQNFMIPTTYAGLRQSP